MPMRMRTSSERHREVMIRIGLDPSQMEVPVEKTKQYMQELTNVATTSNRTVAQSAKDATTASQRVVSTLGRMRLRRAPITLMTTEFAHLANGLTGLHGSANLARTGMYTLTSAISGIVPQVGIAAVAVGGLVSAFILQRVDLNKSSKAFESYREELHRSRGEQNKLKEEIKDFFEGVPKYNKLLWMLIRATLGEGAAAAYAASKTAKWHEEHKGFQDGLNRQISLLTIEGDLINNENVPALESLVSWYREEITRLKELDVVGEAEIDRLRDLNTAHKNLADTKERLKMARIAEARVIKEAPELRGGFIPMTMPTVEPIDESKITEAKNRLVEIWGTAPPVLYDDWDQYWDDVEMLNRRHQQAVMGYVDNISAAFSNAFVGIETDWGKMLQNMVAQLAQSALTSLIMSLLFPGGPAGGKGGFMGWFSDIIGFQQGTPFVPRTGWYQLHRGERVTPAYQNISNIRNQYGGATTQNFYLISLDVEDLTQKKIVPAIERASRLRQTKIMTA